MFAFLPKNFAIRLSMSGVGTKGWPQTFLRVWDPSNMRHTFTSLAPTLACTCLQIVSLSVLAANQKTPMEGIQWTLTDADS